MNTPAETIHPATDHVKNYLSGNDQCLVLWGLKESRTDLCAKNIARGIIKAGGMAFYFNCDVHQRNIEHSFLEWFRVKTMEDFLRYLPQNNQHIWVIFDSVSSVDLNFIQRLVEVSKNGNFKTILQFHNTTDAMHALRWADQSLQIRLVEPVRCCRWNEQMLNAYKNKTNATLDIQLGAESGCIAVENQAQAAELAVRWEMGANRLTRFIQHEWSAAGALTVPFSTNIAISHNHAPQILYTQHTQHSIQERRRARP